MEAIYSKKKKKKLKKDYFIYERKQERIMQFKYGFQQNLFTISRLK